MKENNSTYKRAGPKRKGPRLPSQASTESDENCIKCKNG